MHEQFLAKEKELQAQIQRVHEGEQKKKEADKMADRLSKKLKNLETNESELRDIRPNHVPETEQRKGLTPVGGDTTLFEQAQREASVQDARTKRSTKPRNSLGSPYKEPLAQKESQKKKEEMQAMQQEKLSGASDAAKSLLSKMKARSRATSRRRSHSRLGHG